MKREIRWTIANGLLCIVTYYSCIKHINWATNIMLFMVWLQFIVSLFLAGRKEIRDKFRKNGRTVPEWMDSAIDFALLIIMISDGRFFTGAAWLFSNAIVLGIHRGLWDEKDENTGQQERL